MRKILPLFLIGVLFIALNSCGSKGFETPGEVVKHVFTKLGEEDFNEAFKYVRTEDGALTEEQKGELEQEISGDLEEMGGLKDVKIGEVQEEGDEAEVRVTLIFGNGEEDGETVDVMKVDGKWYVIFG